MYQHSNSASVTKNVPKPDLAELAGRTRCYTCWEIGHFSQNCPKRRVQTPGTDAGVRAVSCEPELMATADVLSAHESHLEKLVRECSTRVEVREDTDWSKCSQTPCGSQWERTSLAVKRAPSEVTGFDDSTQHSQGAVQLEWDLAETNHSLRGTCGSWEFGTAVEPFRFE